MKLLDIYGEKLLEMPPSNVVKVQRLNEKQDPFQLGVVTGISGMGLPSCQTIQ